jgi:hypothetical protein
MGSCALYAGRRGNSETEESVSMKGKPNRKKVTVRKTGDGYTVFAILPILQADTLAKAQGAKRKLDKLMTKLGK